MPHAFDLLLLAVYYSALAVLVLFGMHRGWLAYVFRKRGPEPAVPFEALLASREAWPRVTVQLPMYNERLVAERVIRAAARLAYPLDRLQIQVLDDSTDETRDVVDATVAELARRGLDIVVVRRADRVGFKAGALAHGSESATGEFIAVFDADFVPPSGFLTDLLGHFADGRVGAVQARWEHLNRDGMLLTRAQATLLDGHFVVEQTARSRLGHFFNFNGTAGIWRARAIVDAGGWEHDTITEDLDLSYRAQLAGWRFVYRTDVVAPAELPADLGGFKSQQHRWAKGSIECWRKLAMRVLRSDVPWRTKVEALIHLSANLSYIAMVVVALTMPLTLAVRERFPAALGWGLDLPLFLLGTGSVISFYVTSQRFIGRRVWAVLAELPFVLAVDIGVSIHKARAVLEAMVGHQTAFVRTPKLALVRRSPRRVADAYLRRTWTAGVAEWCLTAWLVYGLAAAYGGPWPSILPVPFVALFAVGYAYVGGVAVVQALPSPQRTQRALSVEA
jgi:cellulose synthase/poly-beta-1,6-N-acetylglucosamine synthase-like glycosyltransferase